MEQSYFTLDRTNKISLPRESLLLDADHDFCRGICVLSAENIVYLSPSGVVIELCSGATVIKTRSDWEIYLVRFSSETLPYCVIICFSSVLCECFINVCNDKGSAEQTLRHILSLEAEGKRESKKHKILTEIDKIISTIL